ncbi:MAG: hypothetical protein M3M97_04535 [Actinomycetota bacterium]|nr:hypothetical protein [Actinomycetota bacterium]
MEDYSVECSGRVVLECKGCQEKLILLGREEDWREEGLTTFACGRCGRGVALPDDRADEEALAVKEILRSNSFGL